MKSHGYWTIKPFLCVLTGVVLVATGIVWANSQQVSSVFQPYHQPLSFAGRDEVVVIGEPVEFFGQGASAVSYTHLTLPTTPYV